MKTLTLLMALFAFTFSLQANAEPRSMEIWDGSFAYNKVIVSELDGNNDFLIIEITGSTLGLSEKMEGLPAGWARNDKVSLAVRKDNCSVDFNAKSIDCQTERTRGTVTWTINPRVSKTIETDFRAMTLEAKTLGFSAQVLFEATIPKDRDFTPHDERLVIDFSQLSF